jgi:hypothetical protein
MGVFSRISNGWKMGTASLKIINKNKQLILFPIISSVFLFAVLASFAGIGYASYGMEYMEFFEQGSTTDYLITFVFYLISYFVIVFFNIGLVHCARIYFQGGEPKFSDGIKFSTTRISVIFSWSILAATIGAIVSGLIGMVWSVATFFVVPVLAYENLGPIEAVKRSGSIVKNKWGESIGASFSFGILTFLGMLLIALPIGLILSMINPMVGIIAGIALVFLIQSVVSSAEMVFISSVYHQLVDKMPLQDYESDILDDLFIEKKKKGLLE